MSDANALNIAIGSWAQPFKIYRGDELIAVQGNWSSTVIAEPPDPIDIPGDEGLTTNGNGNIGIPFGPGQFTDPPPPGPLERVNLDFLLGAGTIAPATYRALALIGAVQPVAKLSRLWKGIIGAEAIDLLTPGFDLPSPSDLPGAIAEIPGATWDLVKTMVDIGGRVGSQFFGPGGRDASKIRVGVAGIWAGMEWAEAQHGPVVSTWEANGVPFVQFMDGWQAAQKLTGAWKFWKPKKPVVYVPGGPMSRRTAIRMAGIYKRARNDAKKTFNLVDSKPRGRTASVEVTESGPGSVTVKRGR